MARAARPQYLLLLPSRPVLTDQRVTSSWTSSVVRAWAAASCRSSSHTSGSNSPAACGLTLRYTPGAVRAYLGWDEKGVAVAGTPAAHWSNRPRPTED